MKQLYFTRHGLSVMNKQGLRSGSTNTPLTDEGRTSATIVGQTTDLQFDLIVTSVLDRAIETAQLIAKEIDYPLDKIYQSALLNERDFGVLENQIYVQGEDTDDVGGIELEADILARAQQAIDWINTLPGESVLIVAHGAIGRALRHIINPTIPFNGIGFPNTEIIKLQ